MQRCTSARPRPARSSQLRELQVDMAAAAKGDVRSRAWEAHAAAAAAAALTGQNASQGAASDPGQKPEAPPRTRRPGRGLDTRLRAPSARGTPSTFNPNARQK
jgi:hypothetical protein